MCWVALPEQMADRLLQASWKSHPFFRVSPGRFGHKNFRPRRLPSPCHAGPAHAPRNHRGVARHAAPRRQHALGRVQAVDVVRAGLDAHQQHLDVQTVKAHSWASQEFIPGSVSIFGLYPVYHSFGGDPNKSAFLKTLDAVWVGG